ncbi:MAG: chemotaxis response regulator protein-glutamate methylesterase [Acidocella sp. 20-57-95]|nr:MAG: chemotaxis response regulator protein-glutamate methylesterase [Acidocella sp. 20-57-95]OYV59559.1 MAG: chemotaxis response regulator protein-glutamate methylesterase [Acidocella sp. 21-58-7]HQT63332.1 chemotaxis response regulator protein-glutamate methylesterase [Acidocella sp.]HQU04595.1 chemotaxis response regulator protein-glutamate methylesterase [Acidocella sp.]
MSVRVLVVDDSATMRRIITTTLQADPAISVVGEAADPSEAQQAIRRLCPDVLTLDIEMPNMNGLAFLEKLMRLRPIPVVMVSSLTQAGAEINLRALELGAFDCVAKPNSLNSESFELLGEKVKAASRSRRIRSPKPPLRRDIAPHFSPNGRVVAIGSSTGGVEALVEILSQFPANCPPTLISQHMPATFTKSFAERLNRLCAANVAEATDGAPIQVGNIYLAPGDAHLEIRGLLQPVCKLNHEGRVNGHRPSVDVMFNAVSRHFKSRALGVILTGMGRDGADGLLALRQAGAETIGQDEASCVVYGMPKVAFEIGAITRQMPLDRIAPLILQLTSRTKSEAAL